MQPDVHLNLKSARAKQTIDHLSAMHMITILFMHHYLNHSAPDLQVDSCMNSVHY